MRIKNNVFIRLALFMIGFGVLIGILFPFFTLMMGVSKGIAMSPLFFLLCIIAGIMVGAVNICLARLTVQNKLKRLSSSMFKVKEHLKKVVDEGEEEICSSKDCYIPVDSSDEFGISAQAFNELLSAFEESLRTQNAFRDYNKTLTTHIDINTLCLNSLKSMISYTHSSAGAILTIKSGQLELKASEGIKEAASLVKSPILFDVIKTLELKKITLPDDIIIDGLLTHIKPKSIIIDPIIYKDAIIGIVVLASLDEFSDQTINHLQVFCKSLALALNNSLEHTQLQALVAIDPLTGVYNRRFGDDRLSEEFASAIRTNTSVGVLMIDIDHFKNVNDTYGHIAGDKVLIEITNMARAVLRKHDILMRYGGEEFAAILPGASTHDTLVVADRLRELVENTQIRYGDNKIFVTVSIGVVSTPNTNVSNAQQLIKFADEALYRAKESGRNKVQPYNFNVVE